MPGRQMEGDNRYRRKKARAAKERGHRPSEEAETLGASKQRHRAAGNEEHPEKLKLIRQGKQKAVRENTPEPRPGSQPRKR